MLFNSYEFIFVFLPLSALGFYTLRRYVSNGDWALAFLVLASLFFYGWWEPRYLLVITGSMLANYGIGRQLIRRHQQGLAGGRLLLGLGIAGNLAALGYFKYTTFVLENLQAVTSFDVPVMQVVLPLAISFFTFQQIAFLVDAYRGECRDYNFTHYCLFVSFFPQLIAGPIVHHAEMMPQFMRPRRATFWNDMHVGLSFFCFGLIKKVLIADEIAQWSTPVFAAADGGQTLSTLEAWGGAAAYSLQLYFDFSGYADMAIGAARLFGIHLPLNFHSPYKAQSIIDFWRRWHMTLSRFLRDYLYIPLGGNRHGPVARYRNLLITMLLGGIWHGAGWNFLIWGGLHGSYLVVNHLFHHWRPQPRLPGWLVGFMGWLLTTLCVLIAWVFFRAETFAGAMQLLQSMLITVHTDVATTIWQDSADSGLKRIILFYGIALLLPNTQQLLHYAQPTQVTARWWHWRANGFYGVLTAALLIFTVFQMSAISEFLYFQF